MATSIYKEKLCQKRRELQAAIEAIDDILKNVQMCSKETHKAKEEHK